MIIAFEDKEGQVTDRVVAAGIIYDFTSGRMTLVDADQDMAEIDIFHTSRLIIEDEGGGNSE